MNIQFTIPEENIVAIYAEDSREMTVGNILAAMPYRLWIAPACRRYGEKAASHDGQRIF